MNQNKIVLLLPLTVMVGLFIIGYLSLSQSQSVTNEELNRFITFEIEANSENEDSKVYINWQWMDYPSDGLLGNDYIEIVLLNEDREPVDFILTNSQLKLFQSEEIIYENEILHQSKDGFIFTFPNKVEENLLYGPYGELNFILSEQAEETKYIEARYYHTWEGLHTSLTEGENISEWLDDAGTGEYWVIQRTERLSK